MSKASKDSEFVRDIVVHAPQVKCCTDVIFQEDAGDKKPYN